MNRKTYRICLIVIIIAAALSGIYYYHMIQKKEIIPKDGIFVQKFFAGSEDI